MSQELTLDGAAATTKDTGVLTGSEMNVTAEKSYVAERESPVEQAEPRAVHAVRDLRKTSAEEIERLLNEGYEPAKEVDTGISKLMFLVKVND